MKRFNKVEKFYIDNCGLEPKEIAKDLGVVLKTVQHYLDFKAKQKKDEEDLLALEEKKKQEEIRKNTILATDLMQRVPNRGVTIMTKEASELGDSMRKGPSNVKFQKNVHKIRE